MDLLVSESDPIVFAVFLHCRFFSDIHLKDFQLFLFISAQIHRSDKLRITSYSIENFSLTLQSSIFKILNNNNNNND